MFAYTALPFSLVPQCSFALFFLSILFATAAGVTAFLLLASGNLQNLQDKFDHRKKPRNLPIVSDNGEILATKEDVRFHIDILETKLKNKSAELEAWKGKLNTAEIEMQKLNNASGEVRRHYMKLKTDVVKTEDDCKEIQNQINEFRRRQAEICPELVEKKGHSCSLLINSKGISKTRSDTPPEAYGRVATVMKSLKSLTSIQHFKNLSGAVSHLLLTTLSSIGIILPHEAPHERRRQFEHVPNIFFQRHHHQPDHWSHFRGQKDYICTRNGDKKYIKVVNFPFPPKSPPPTFLSNMILWAIKQLRVKKETKDRAVNHCSECYKIPQPTKSYYAEQRITEKIADKLKTLIIFQFLEEDQKNKTRNKNTPMNNDGHRKLAKILKINDSLLSRLLSSTKNRNEDIRSHNQKKHSHESSKADAEMSNSFETQFGNNNDAFENISPQEVESPLTVNKSKLLYVRSQTDTEESSKDNRKSDDIAKIITTTSASQLQKKRLELIHMNDSELANDECLRNESETPFASDDLSTNELLSKRQLYTTNSKVSSIESEALVEKKLQENLEWESTKSSFVQNSTHRDSLSSSKGRSTRRIKLSREQMCLVSILPKETSISVVLDVRRTKSEAVSCSLLKIRLSQTTKGEDAPQNTIDEDHKETVPKSSTVIAVKEEKSPTTLLKCSPVLQKKSKTSDDMKITNTYSKLLSKVSYSSHYAKNSKEQLKSSPNNKVTSPSASEAEEKKSRNLSKANGRRTVPFTSLHQETIPDKKSTSNTSGASLLKSGNSNLEFQKSIKPSSKNKQPNLEISSARKQQNISAPMTICSTEANRQTEPNFNFVLSASDYRAPKHWQTCNV